MSQYVVNGPTDSLLPPIDRTVVKYFIYFPKIDIIKIDSTQNALPAIVQIFLFIRMRQFLQTNHYDSEREKI